jgi:hypothetical protein
MGRGAGQDAPMREFLSKDNQATPFEETYSAVISDDHSLREILVDCASPERHHHLPRHLVSVWPA